MTLIIRRALSESRSTPSSLRKAVVNKKLTEIDPSCTSLDLNTLEQPYGRTLNRLPAGKSMRSRYNIRA